MKQVWMILVFISVSALKVKRNPIVVNSLQGNLICESEKVNKCIEALKLPDDSGEGFINNLKAKLQVFYKDNKQISKEALFSFIKESHEFKVEGENCNETLAGMVKSSHFDNDSLKRLAEIQGNPSLPVGESVEQANLKIITSAFSTHANKLSPEVLARTVSKE